MSTFYIAAREMSSRGRYRFGKVKFQVRLRDKSGVRCVFGWNDAFTPDD